MKSLLAAILLLSMTGVMASEIQLLNGAEAYELYKKLPGVSCREWGSGDSIVYTKYQTKNCNITQTDDSKWTCTVQFIVKNGKTAGYTGADCSRQI